MFQDRLDAVHDPETGLRMRFIREWKPPNPADTVRDGRHLMNGTRWIDVKLGEPAPSYCVGLRLKRGRG